MFFIIRANFPYMQIFRTKSKVLIPLVGAFASLIIFILLSWVFSYYYSHHVYDALDINVENSEKMVVLTQLIETARSRTRLTGQMLITEDVFDRDAIAQKLDIYASRFAILRLKLLSFSLSKTENDILTRQTQLIETILPKQRLAAELAMNEDLLSFEKAKLLLYEDVIPGQEELISHFMKMIKLTRDDIKKSSETTISRHKSGSNNKLALIVIFTLLIVLVASITMKKILHIERGFSEANEELIHLNNVRSEFISLVSHELRTPLTSIKSFAEILMDDIENMDIGTQKRYLSIIDSEGDRLSRLVSNILDIQKIDANKMDWKDEEMVLNDVAQKSVDAFSAAYKAKNVSLSIAAVPDDLTVIADSDKLAQVFSNLLSNALKFTEEGEVLVSVFKYRVHNSGESVCDMARVTVSDTGAGIPDDQLIKVFDSFHQVDNSATRKAGGSGLGLDICRKIINHYEGNIWVESQPGKGSCFYFEIPLVNFTRKKIGDTLIELGMITDDQLRIALQEQEK